MDSDVCAASISRVSDNFMNAGVHSLDGEGQAESDGTVGCVCEGKGEPGEENAGLLREKREVLIEGEETKDEGRIFKDVEADNGVPQEKDPQEVQTENETENEQVTTSRRGSRRRSSLGDEAHAMIASFKGTLLGFIVQSGFFSLMASIVPLLGIVVMMSYSVQYTDAFFGSEATTVPPILHNVTVVPFDSAFRKRYYAQSEPVRLSLVLVQAAFWFCGSAQFPIRARVMFRPNKKGVMICLIMTVAMSAVCFLLMMNEYVYVAEHGEYRPFPFNALDSAIPMVMAVGVPATFTVAYAYSPKRDKETHSGLAKAFVVFYACLGFEGGLMLLSTRVVNKYFFLSSSGILVRFLVRSLSQLIGLNLGVEISWLWSKYAVANMGCDIHDASVGSLGGLAVSVPLFARMLQGSAETLVQSIIFEVAATIAELKIADSLLKR